MGGAASLRVALYRHGVLRQQRLRGPVVSVGNLSVGGSGKTPVVAKLARLLMEDGHAVAILSRGYGGSSRRPCLLVSDGTSIFADAATAGDEPTMLARQLPGVVVAVGPHRDVVGRDVEARFGPRVHVLDDGFQHLRLARDLDVACVSMRDLDDRPLPAGWLREASAALGRAHVLLLARDGTSDTAIDEAQRALGRERTFVTTRRSVGFFSADGTSVSAPARALLISGVARPERFAADIAAAGVTVVGHRAFRDHHAFTAAELQAAAAHAQTQGADALVTTEKDAVRIASPPGGRPWLVFRIDVAIEDEDRFRSRLRDVVPPRPRGR
jgi:tetraacyldisaccharide 4'-kinase